MGEGDDTGDAGGAMVAVMVDGAASAEVAVAVALDVGWPLVGLAVGEGVAVVGVVEGTAVAV